MDARAEPGEAYRARAAEFARGAALAGGMVRPIIDPRPPHDLDTDVAA